MLRSSKLERDMLGANLVTKEAVRKLAKVKQVEPNKNLLSSGIQELLSMMLEKAEITHLAAVEIMKRKAVAGQRKKWSLFWVREITSGRGSPQEAAT